MSIADSVPGMRPGHTLRNLLVAGLAVSLGPFLLAVAVALLPLIAAVSVALDYRGAAGRFDVLPGIRTGGGAKAGVAAGCYVLLLFAVVGAASGGGSETTSAPTTTSTPSTASSTTVSTTVGSPTTAQPATTAQPTTLTPATTRATVTATRTTATTTPTTQSPTTSTEATTQSPTATTAPTTLSTSTAPTGAQRTTYTVTVTEVVDGDTLDVRYANGTLDTVRLVGVDTPETYSGTSPEEFEGIPDTPAGREWLDDWGVRATDYVRSVTEGETVTLVVDDEGDRRGYYGRLLAYVDVNSSYQLNYALLENGYARVYDSRFSQSSRFYDAESRAQSNDVGLWGFDAETTTAAEPGAGTLEVVRIHEDAAGDEYENLDDEYVVFENTGGETLSLGGWTVYDEADHEYVFPAGVELEPGERVTLHTGQGTDAGGDLYWGMAAPVWNNDGDTVFVQTAAGNLVVEESYA